jgi:ligand-binding sensor domain-containing protein
MIAQVGTWQSYTDMKNIRAIDVTESGVYAASSGGSFFYDNASKEFQKHTNVSGLASNDLTAILLDSKNRLFVGSFTGDINELVPGSGWRTIPDIARAVTFPKRGINVIKEQSELLFLGTDFGIVIYDPDKREFGDTYTKFGSLPQQISVNDIFFHDDSIWVATDEGVAVADMRSSNLQDPLNWFTYTTNDGLPSGVVNAISMFRGQIVAGTEAGLAMRHDLMWSTDDPEVTGRIVQLLQRGENLYTASPNQILLQMHSGGFRVIGEFLQFPEYPAGTAINCFDVTADETVYISTNIGFASAVHVTGQAQPWVFNSPNGPNSNQFLSMSIDGDGNLWSASGRDGLGRGIYMFDGSQWTNFNKSNTALFNTDDFVVSASGHNGEMWFGTWGEGIYKRSPQGQFVQYSPKSVPGYPGIANDDQFAVTSAIKVDRDGNVYTLHPKNNSKIISRFSPDGSWRYYIDPTVLYAPDMGALEIDEFGNKWLIITEGAKKGILVFNENGTLDDKSNDSWTALPTGASRELIASDVSSLAVDGFGDIWIGTNQGIRTVFNPQEPDRITRTCFNTRCNIEGENITCLAIDPVNNKWIGTYAGVFVLSSDGSTILDQFNTDNSLLLDNQINSIVIHPESGIAYIGTNKGLSAYVTPYQQAQAEFSDLKIYPNPFKPRSDGEVNIQGLVEETSIKILSISGNLVAEFTTPGGNIGFWNGRTANGDYAPTGIYYIAAYTVDGKKAAVGKVAVINE